MREEWRVKLSGVHYSREPVRGMTVGHV
ncbi:protein of unknown function [Nocardia cyriacigeorgica GUH-2]|uniref:Uncharacterized protein n=1 Tax=Nocardia cyriacigeorgica (strain GUH-2) TaxID=1127134 RepID=H6R2U6_NOCCG|nr:protein of unknown function [Nocardia cyriacigeorgica GUH-2]